MINVGIIGLGVGKHHLNAIIDNPLCKLTHVCDFDKKLLRKYKKKYPKIIFTDDENVLINNSDIEVVSIASYDYYHYEQIIKSLKNKKNVFVEKPICLNKKELQNIFNILKLNSDLKISSNLVLRTEPDFIKLKNQISKNKFGKIFYGEADYYWGRIDKFYGWRSKFKYSIILGAAIHMIDLLIWMIGELPYKVSSFANSISTKSRKFDHNSFVVIILEFKNGLIFKITGNGGCAHPHFHGIKIFSDKQTYIHNLTSTIKVTRSSKNNLNLSKINSTYPSKQDRKNVINSFIKNLYKNNNNEIVTKKDIYILMTICFAAEESLIKSKTQIIKY